jgi:hypothetical protein
MISLLRDDVIVSARFDIRLSSSSNGFRSQFCETNIENSAII